MRERTELLFINDNGATITIRGQESYKYCISSVDFGGIGEDTFTSKVPLEHGELYDGMCLSTRDIVGSAYLFEKGDKSEVLAALSPLTECTLVVQGRRFLRGKLIGTPTFTYHPFTMFTFTFRAFSPFFMEQEKTFKMDDSTGFYLTNNGDVSTPLKITLHGKYYTTGGEETFGMYPYIENVTTGQFINFVKPSLESATRGVLGGESIVANTDISQKTIVWNKLDGSVVNAYPLMTTTSTLFQLAKGKNEFKLSAKCYTSENAAASNVGGIDVQLDYSERFFEWR